MGSVVVRQGPAFVGNPPEWSCGSPLPVGAVLLALCGFAMACLWINAFANELVCVQRPEAFPNPVSMPLAQATAFVVASKPCCVPGAVCCCRMRHLTEGTVRKAAITACRTKFCGCVAQWFCGYAGWLAAVFWRPGPSPQSSSGPNSFSLGKQV